MKMEVYSSNIENRQLILEGNFKTLSLSFSDEEMLRIKHYDKDGEVEFSYLKEDVEFEIEFGIVKKSRNEIIMLSKKLCVEISLDPFNIKIFKINGGLIFSGDDLDFINIEEKKSRIKFNLNMDTSLFGVFKDDTGKFKYFPKVKQLVSRNKSRKVLYELANSNFLFTSNKFGFFVNNSQDIRYSFNKNVQGEQDVKVFELDIQSIEDKNFKNAVSEIIIDSEYFDIFLIFKDSNDEFVRQYTNLIGKTPLLPKWSYGYIHSKGGNFGPYDLISAAENFRKKEIPIDAMEFDSNNFDYKDLSSFDNFFKKNDISLVVSAYPFINGDNLNFEEKNDKELILDKIKGLQDENIKGYRFNFKTYSQKEKSNAMLWAKFINGRSNESKRNFFLIEETHPGLSKYGAVINNSNMSFSWEGLRDNVKRLIISGISGEPYFSSSLCSSYSDSVQDEELFIRWLQVAVFSPIFIFGNSIFFSEPWVFGESIEKIVSDFIKLRYSMMPYIYSNMRKTFDAFKPFIEPVSFDIEDEYYFGENMIVAPILEKDVMTRKVILPEGKWWDYWSRSLYEGGKEFYITSHLSRIPLFLKAGSIIPATAGIHNADEKIDHLYLHIFPGGDGRFTIYDDDGESNDYLENGFMNIEISYSEEEDDRSILIKPSEGSYKDMIDNKNIMIYIHNVHKIEDLKIDGKLSDKYKYYEEEQFILIDIEDYDLKDGCEITYKNRGKLQFQNIEEKSCSIDLFAKRNGIYILRIIALNYEADTDYKIDLMLPEGYSVEAEDEKLCSKIKENLNLNFEIVNLMLGERAIDNIKVSVKIGDDLYEENFDIAHGYATKWSVIDCIYGEYKEVEAICEIIENEEEDIYLISGGEKRLWLKANSGDSSFGLVNFNKLKEQSNAVAYAKTKLYIHDEQEVLFEISCSNNIALFVNNKKEFESDDILYKHISDKTSTLLKGWNSLLVKVRSNEMAKDRNFLGFRLSILDINGNRIEDIYFDY